MDSASNIPGVEVVEVHSLNAELLAPGCDLARLTIYTKESIEKIEKEQLFTDEIKLEKPIKKEIKKTPKKQKEIKPKKTMPSLSLLISKYSLKSLQNWNWSKSWGFIASAINGPIKPILNNSAIDATRNKVIKK